MLVEFLGSLESGEVTPYVQTVVNST